jgi:outer membrane PBP1 activator LpoA protein
MIHRYLIVLIFSVPLLYGCSLATKLRYQSDIDQAKVLLQQGHPKKAAIIYKKLAALNSSQHNQFQLLAADALIASDNIKQGKLYIDAINTAQLTPVQFNHLKLLQAQVLLSTGAAQTALPLFKSMQVASLARRSKFAYYDGLALTYSLLGNFVKSAETLIALNPLIVSANKRLQHYNKILDTLIAAPTHALKIQQNAISQTLKGWISLAQLFRARQVNLTQSFANWQQNYPNHPVTAKLLLTYEKDYKQRFSLPRTIAVFLPHSGRYAEAGQIIKQGFMAAYNHAKTQNPNYAEVIFYDTQSRNIVELYHQAINEGAQLIIGPLHKKHLQTLANRVELNVPVLALNHIEGLTRPRLYQFGLSPIDDAVQIAYKAYQDGHKNALLLIPESRKGERIAGYFTRHWQQLGANIANIEIYNPTQRNFNQTIELVANKALTSGGVDVVFMNAYAKQGRLLNPLLRYKQATANLPIYATSQIYVGTPNSSRDQSLNGITFCDVPWVFAQVYQGALSKTALHSLWRELPPLYLRFIPLGIDAYNLIAHLDQLKTQPYLGATGKLSLGADNRINRELFCAQFINGQPNLLNFSSEKTRFTPTVTAPTSIQ